jgi:hypothetical protein
MIRSLVALLLLTACTAESETPDWGAGTQPRGETGSDGTGGAGDGWAAPTAGGSEPITDPPATGGASSGGALVATGGTIARACRWSCLSVTRWSSGATPVAATTSIDNVDCSSSPADVCTVAGSSAVHSVCAVGDVAPAEVTECLPDPLVIHTGSGGSGGSSPEEEWSCRYAATDAVGAVIDEVTLYGDCSDPCPIMVPRVCSLLGLADCPMCERTDLTCTFEGESMATEHNGLGLSATCL